MGISDADVDNTDGKGTIIVGVMQKERRRMKKEGIDLLTIGYAVYKVVVDLLIPKAIELDA